MFKTKLFIFTTFMFLTLSSCNFGNSQSAGEEASVDQNQPQEDLPKAPDFSVTSIDGETISLQQSMAEGKPTVIYFTASWCPMCAQNWPAISEVYPEYKDKLNFVSISIDPTDDKQVMTKLAKENDFEFPVTAGNPQVMLDFGVESQATTVGVNQNGYIEFQKDKTVLTAEEYRNLFEQLLK